MTKQLETFFNIPPTPVIVNDDNLSPLKQIKKELMAEAQEVISSLTTAEKVDKALTTVNGLDDHDVDMDKIATRAINTFEDLVILGNNVPDIHAGKIFEVAGQMLRTAMDAKNAKTDKKLKMIELQLKKIRSEQTAIEVGQTPATVNQGAEFDRNELLQHIKSSQTIVK